MLTSVNAEWITCMQSKHGQFSKKVYAYNSKQWREVVRWSLLGKVCIKQVSLIHHHCHHCTEEEFCWLGNVFEPEQELAAVKSETFLLGKWCLIQSLFCSGLLKASILGVTFDLMVATILSWQSHSNLYSSFWTINIGNGNIHYAHFFLHHGHNKGHGMNWEQEE